MIENTWHAIFVVLIVGAIITGILCTRLLPNHLAPQDERTNSSPANILLLAVSTFFLLYILQRSYYDFYNETFIFIIFAMLAGLGLYTFSMPNMGSTQLY